MKPISAVRLPPLAITGLPIAFMVSTVHTANDAAISGAPDWTLVSLQVALALAFVFVQASWTYDMGRLSAARIPADSARRFEILTWSIGLFVSLGTFIALLAFPSYAGVLQGVDSHPAFAFVGIAFSASYFVASWQAASLLVQAEGLQDKGGFTFATFLLLLYLLIGVWTLKPRVLRLI